MDELELAVDFMEAIAAKFKESEKAEAARLSTQGLWVSEGIYLS